MCDSESESICVCRRQRRSWSGLTSCIWSLQREPQYVTCPPVPGSSVSSTHLFSPLHGSFIPALSRSILPLFIHFIFVFLHIKCTVVHCFILSFMLNIFYSNLILLLLGKQFLKMWITLHMLWYDIIQTLYFICRFLLNIHTTLQTVISQSTKTNAFETHLYWKYCYENSKIMFNENCFLEMFYAGVCLIFHDLFLIHILEMSYACCL